MSNTPMKPYTDADIDLIRRQNNGAMVTRFMATFDRLQSSLTIEREKVKALERERDDWKVRFVKARSWLHSLRADFYGDGAPVDRCKAALTDNEAASLFALIHVDIFYEPTTKDIEEIKKLAKEHNWTERMSILAELSADRKKDGSENGY